MILGVASLVGAPGATTFAVMAAGLWPTTTGCVVIEADTSGSALPALLPTVLNPEPSTADLVAQCRHSFDEEALLRSTQRLPHGGDVVVGSPQPTLLTESARQLLSRLDEMRDALESRDVIFDLGRLHTAPLTKTTELDGLFLITELSFAHVEPLLRQIEVLTAAAPRLAVVAVVAPKLPGTVPVDPDDFREQLWARTDGAVGLAGVLDHSPKDASAWFNPTARRLERSALSRQTKSILHATIRTGGTRERI